MNQYSLPIDDFESKSLEDLIALRKQVMKMSGRWFEKLLAALEKKIA